MTSLAAEDRTTIEQDMVNEWDALMRLRNVIPVSEQARARKIETENRHLRELQRLSLLAARLYAEDAKLVEALRMYAERVTDGLLAREALADIDSRATKREDATPHGSSH